MGRKGKIRREGPSPLMLDYDATTIRSLSDEDVVAGLLDHTEARFHGWDGSARRGERLAPIFEAEVYRRMKGSARA